MNYQSFPKYIENNQIILYVDRNFDEESQDKIISAALQWTFATHHIIEFNVVILPTQEKIKINQGIFIVKVSSDFPEIIWKDNLSKNITLGLYFGNTPIKTILLVDDRLTDNLFLPVILHELGHALELQHTQETGTLMYPIVDEASYIITQRDLNQFCQIHHCDPKNLY